MVGFGEVAGGVEGGGEELVAMFGYAGIDEDGVYAGELCVRGGEGGALGGPGGDVAGVDEEVGGRVGEGWGWGVEVEQDEVVVWVEGGEESGGCETDS